ncbi:fimbrial biogenesis chaperone [Pseudomonas fluorescens]|uniref:fimbrial biogenesis chaperone n=1 Tax=Pseudomonas TaxID=286 RepID=UPI003D061E31
MFKDNRLLTSRPYLTTRLGRVLLLLLLWVVTQAQASLKIEGTRLIYFGKDKEASISVINQTAQDTVLQSWISHEDDSDTSALPFAIVQPLVQLHSQERHLLRIFYVGEGLPDDRESQLWLNIMEIPLKPENPDSVQFAIRQRLKLFYRPPDLQGSASEAVQKLIWKKPDGQRIEIRNPSQFHLSLVDVGIGSGSHTQKLSEYVFLKPGEDRLIETPTIAISADTKITFTEITDIGLQTRHSANLQ